ncbi:cytochrome P450 2F5-like isoform X3 [Varanus komodoensis]|uniref:cytochrome P450 2F5-like isoform X3 n=1 Tax=Varanus komodoensis TaxID=61221 RepID=UPI001CF7DBEB|nr:cytochrome P450 2F5-like isoform X3 [Varanus komodoensis]
MDLGAAAPLALLLLACLACLALYLNGKQGGRGGKGRLPPGPTPLPLLGNLLQLDPNEMHRSLEKLGERFGPVYTVHLGSLPCVVLCGYQAVREALVEQADDFSGRGDFPVFHRFTRGNGIAFSNGEKWKTLRRFALHALKNFGMGRRSIEVRIQEEAQCLVQEFRKTGGAPFNPLDLVCRAVSNVICAVVFGRRFDYEDAAFLVLLNHLNDNFRIMSSAWGEEKQDPLSHFHMETLVMTTHNLFFGGTETTSTTLRYSFLILMKHPEVAARVHEEIDRVIGPERTPCLADRKHMPYTDAVLYEVQRFISILPMGLPRAVTRDTPFRGYLLPKGTNVIPLLSSVHYDPSQFKDPTSFNPANFLGENNEFRSSDAFMPFAPGKRICLGAGLARMELFLFLVTILQRFTLRPLVSPAEIDLTPQSTGLGNVPRPFQLRLLPR